MKRPGRQPAKGSYRNVPAGVPPIAPRRGVNSKKESETRSDRKRTKRAGVFRRIFSALRSLVAAALVLAALGGGGLAAYKAFDHTGFLVLREVRVEGNRLWDRKDILEKAGIELGMRLPMIPVAKAESSLLSLPGVAGVEVRRIYPSRLDIRVTEHVPVACGYSRGWRGLAPDGSTLPGLDPGDSDLPVVDGFSGMGQERRALLGAFLEAVRKEYPALYANFSQLSFRGRPLSFRGRPTSFRGEPSGPRGQPSGPAELEIVLRDGRLKVLVEIGNKSLSSLEFLQAMMRQQKGSLEPGKTVDLRVEGYAYVR